MRRIYPKDYII